MEPPLSASDSQYSSMSRSSASSDSSNGSSSSSEIGTRVWSIAFINYCGSVLHPLTLYAAGLQKVPVCQLVFQAPLQHQMIFVWNGNGGILLIEEYYVEGIWRKKVLFQSSDGSTIDIDGYWKLKWWNHLIVHIEKWERKRKGKDGSVQHY